MWRGLFPLSTSVRDLGCAKMKRILSWGVSKLETRNCSVQEPMERDSQGALYSRTRTTILQGNQRGQSQVECGLICPAPNGRHKQPNAFGSLKGLALSQHLLGPSLDPQESEMEGARRDKSKLFQMLKEM